MRSVLDFVAIFVLAVALITLINSPAEAACSVNCVEFGKGTTAPWWAPGTTPGSLVCHFSQTFVFSYLTACSALPAGGNVVVQGQSQTVQLYTGCTFPCALKDCNNNATLPQDAVPGKSVMNTSEVSGTCVVRS